VRTCKRWQHLQQQLRAILIKFTKNLIRIISRGATVDDPIQILFDAYEAVPCYNFKKYIENQQNDYLDGKLTGLTHEALRKMAKSKFNWLVNKKCGALDPLTMTKSLPWRPRSML
jgi:hypothetical protein